MSEIVLAQTAAVPAAPPPRADLSREEQIEKRYLDAIEALIDDSIREDAPFALAEALAWTLARVIVAFDRAAVAGIILKRLGTHIGTLAERKSAAAEAAQAKKEGRAPH